MNITDKYYIFNICVLCWYMVFILLKLKINEIFFEKNQKKHDFFQIFKVFFNNFFFVKLILTSKNQ